MSGDITKQGWARKQGGLVRNWKKRWFVLQGTMLRYLVRKDGSEKGKIDLRNVKSVGKAPECRYQPAFKLSIPGVRTYYIVADSSRNCEDWIQAIEHARNVDTSSGEVASPASAPKKVTIDDFEIIRVIGRGSYGKVQLVRNKTDKQLYAMKTLSKRALIESDQVEQTMVERNVLLKTVHPFLVGAHFAFQTDVKIFLVLDYVPGGELFARLRQDRKFDQPRTQLYAAEILLGLAFLHTQGFVYRDLKPENILVDVDGHLRITDFGLVKTNMTSSNSTTQTFCGTPEYIAPEMLQGKPYTRSVDWWSFGILIYEMLSGLPPFYDDNSNKMYRMVINDPVKFPDHMSREAQDLIDKLLDKNPSRRLGAGPEDGEEIKQHVFFQGIDWDKLMKKQIEAPWKPVLTEADDTSNFDREFTQEKTGVSYEPAPVIGEDTGQFPGFTYAPEEHI